MQIYLDNAATTRVCDAAVSAAVLAMTQDFGNPGSTHKMGRDAEKMLRTSRETVSKALGCDAAELYFTSCGTEANNWAIINGAKLNQRTGRHIISSAAEHDCVLRSLDRLEKDGFEVTRLAPQKDGSIAAADVLAALRADTCLVSLMAVNNETGAITDIPEIVRAVKAENPKTLFHTDAVQAFMKIPFSAKGSGVDFASISGHKIHAPKGIGALYIKKGINLPPYLVGGRQENEKRAGTEATAQIAAFSAATAEVHKNFAEDTTHMHSLRKAAAERLSKMDIMLIGGGAPHIISLSLPGYRSEVILNFLEASGIFVSKSSACKKGERSHVLEAMGLAPNVIDGAIRASLSHYTAPEDIGALCDALAAAKRLRHS